MECPDLHKLWREGLDAEDPKIQAHLAECDACAELLANGGALAGVLESVRLEEKGPEVAAPSAGSDEPHQVAPSDPELAGLLSRVETDLERERGVRAWLRARPTWQRMAIGLGTLGLLLVAIVTVMPRDDWAVYPAGRMALAVGAMVLLASLSVGWVLRPLYRSWIPRGRLIGLIALAGAVPFAIGLLPQAHSLHPASLQGTGSDFWPGVAACFLFGLETGLPILVLLRLLDRRAHARWLLAVVAAAAAGLAGNLVLQLHCPITDPAHILVGHAPVLVALIVLYGGAQAVIRRRVPI